MLLIFPDKKYCKICSVSIIYVGYDIDSIYCLRLSLVFVFIPFKLLSLMLRISLMFPYKYPIVMWNKIAFILIILR